jgi:four helix bundle protein
MDSISDFNRRLRERTVDLSTNIYFLVCTKQSQFLNRQMIAQLTRSSSSVAANCSAALRARSDAEFFSKICIVVEECDETQFWVEYLIRINFLTHEETVEIRKEIDELIRIFVSIKQKMRSKTKRM